MISLVHVEKVFYYLRTNSLGGTSIEGVPLILLCAVICKMGEKRWYVPHLKRWYEGGDEILGGNVWWF